MEMCLVSTLDSRDTLLGKQTCIEVAGLPQRKGHVDLVAEPFAIVPVRTTQF